MTIPDIRFLAADATGPNDIWIVGEEGNEGILPTYTFTMHWDGTTWTHIPSPSIPGTLNILRGVTAIAPNDVWAVGYYWIGNNNATLAMHWDGTQWTIVTTPNTNAETTFFAVDALASNDVWAVGEYWNNGAHTFTAHWDGAHWNPVYGPNLNTLDDDLYAVVAIAPNDVWAVGDKIPSGGNQFDQTLTLHWNGTQWVNVTSPNIDPRNHYLWGITATASNDVWAVGEHWINNGNDEEPLALHWNGSTWSIVPLAQIHSDSILRAAHAFTTQNVWAIGDYGYSHPQTRHYSNVCSSPTPTPTATATPTPTVPTPTASPSCSPIVISGSIDPNDPTQSGRLFRDGIASTCASPKPCPGLGDAAPHHYDSYTFTNTTGSLQCVNVDINTACQDNNFIFATAYLGSFDPINICTNYLADEGASPFPNGPFSFYVFNGQTFVLVVSEVTSGAGCPSYTITVSGICPASTATPAPTATATVTLTPTATATPTPTPTPTATPTSTPRPSPTPRPALTPRPRPAPPPRP